MTVKYAVPKEGTIIWFDIMAIPKDAPHPDNAHAWINFIMKPEIAGAISNAVNYANGNKDALPFVSDDVKNDPGVYPPPEVKAKLYPDLAETAGIHAPAESHLDALHDGEVSRRESESRRRTADTALSAVAA